MKAGVAQHPNHLQAGALENSSNAGWFRGSISSQTLQERCEEDCEDAEIKVTSAEIPELRIERCMPRLLPEGPCSLGASLPGHGVRDCQSSTTGTGRCDRWELPEVSFLSRQKYACRDKPFVTTNIFCRDKTRLLSRQK